MYNDSKKKVKRRPKKGRSWSEESQNKGRTRVKEKARKSLKRHTRSSALKPIICQYGVTEINFQIQV